MGRVKFHIIVLVTAFTVAGQACSDKANEPIKTGSTGAQDSTGDGPVMSTEATVTETTATETTATETTATETTATETTETGGSGGAVGWEPAVCGDVTCAEGDICVGPSAECQQYEPGPEDSCSPDDFENPCEIVVAPAAYCAPVPAECNGSDDLASCLEGTFCEIACGAPATFTDGQLDCGPGFCHCGSL